MHSPVISTDAFRGAPRPPRRRRGSVTLWMLVALAVLMGAVLPAMTAEAQDLDWSADIGAVGVAGDSSFDTSTNAYHIKGAGVGLAGTADAFHFAYYQIVRGDGQMVVRLSSADALAQSALVVRESLDAGAASAAAVVSNGGAQYVRRSSTGSNSTVGGAVSTSVPCWLKIVRSGGTINASVSVDGLTWTSLGSDTVNMGTSSIYVGFAVSNGVANATSTAMASFDNIQSTFLPSTGLQLWLKADVGVTQDANGAVSVWADQSGNGNDAFQTTASEQPVAAAAAINNQPTIRFDGSSSFLSLPSGFSDFTQGATALVVARPTAAVAWQRIFELANGPSVDSIVFGRSSSTDHLLFECANGNDDLAAEVASGDGVIALGTPQIFEFSQNGTGGTATLYKNGQALTTQGAAQIGNVTRTSNFIGTTNFGGSFFAGDIAEIVLFNHPLSDFQRQAWETYLNLKYQCVPPPVIPTAFSAAPLSATQIALSWAAGSDNATAYLVERQNADGTWSTIANLGSQVRSYIDGGLTPGTSYAYRISAGNDAGNSLPSAVATQATPATGDPLPVANLRLWLRADVGAVSPLGFWADQSGRGNNAVQTTGSLQPLVTVAALNGEPVVHFGDNSYLNLPDNLMTGAVAGDLLLVMRSTAPEGAYRGLLSLSAAGGGDWVPYGGDSNFYEGFGSSQRYGPFGVSPAWYQYGLYNLTAAPGEWTARLNDQVQFASTSNTVVFPSTGMLLGSSSEGALFEGDIAEVLLFDHALTDAERQSWETYLNAKYQYSLPPATPGDLSVIPLSATQLLLAWTETSASATGYTVERQNADDTWSVIATPGAATTSYLDSGLSPNTAYAYRVTADNNGANSPASAPSGTTTAGGTGSTPFPTDGLQFWLRADAGVTSDASGAVSAWVDPLDGWVASQGNADDQPSLIGADLNGLPAVRFDGAASYLDTNFVGMDGQELTFFVVTKGAQYQSLLRFQPPGSGNYLVYPWSANQLFIDSADGGSGAGVSSGLIPNQWNIGEVVYNAGAQITTYQNGGLVASRAAANTSLPAGLPLEVGRYQAGAEYAQADVAEVLIYNRALSDAERFSVENYLNGKYAVIVPPAAPTSPTVSAISSTQTNLLWMATTGALGYSVERRNVTTGGNFEEVAAIAGGEVQAYVDNGLTAGSICAYRLRAENAAGYSGYSGEVSVTLPVTAMSALPTDDLLLWLRPDAGVTQDANGYVTAWSDASGHGNNAFASLGNEPLWTPDAINGQPVLHFDGSTSYLQLPTGFSDFTQGLTALIITRPASTASWQRFFDIGNGAASDNLLLARNDTSNDLIYDAFTGGGLATSLDAPGVLTLNACQLLEVVQGTAGSVTLYDNGLQVAQGSASPISNVTRTSGFIGKSNWPGALFQGDIAEMALFDHALSDTERQAWETYLQAKYQFNPPPPAPSGLSVTPLSATQVSISWNENFLSVTGYTVERQNADGSWSVIATLSAGATSYVDMGLTPGVSYSYRVTASNAIGSSPTSAVATGAINAAVAASPTFPVSGIRLWLHADAGISLDANGGVTSWADQSGGNMAASQTNSAVRPLLVPNVVNGQPVVRFDGTGRYLNLADNLMAGATAGEVFVVVCAADPLTGTTRGFWFNSDTNLYGSGAFYPANDGTLYETFGSDARYGPMNSPVPLDQFNLYNVAAASGAWTARMNGQVLATTQSNNVAFSAATFLLGISSEGAPFAGDVAELLVFDHVLSDAERAAVQNYCTAKYALNGFLLGNANGDADGDGLTNYEEFMTGTDPLDYYNGQTPQVTIASGNNQLGSPGALVAQPLQVLVTSAAGLPLVNAPVVFTITRSTGLVADPAASANLASSVTVRTGSDGTASALFQAPAGTPTLTSLVTAAAGYADRVSVKTFAEAIVANDDTSGDGLPDGWKLQYGLDITTNDDAGDPDGDGLTNLQEYYLGTNPNVPDFTPDGVPYAWLVARGLDPRYDSTSAVDPNGSGLTYVQEYQLQQSTVDLWPFDEGGQSLTTVSASGHQDTGALINNPTWVPDPDGGMALSFNQTGAQVDVGPAADGHLDFAPTQSFSVTARFQTSAMGTATLVAKGGVASGAPGYLLGITDGHLSAGIGSDNAQSPSLSFQTSAAFNDGQWHHVAATFDRSAQQACLYVDGILQPVVMAAGSAGVAQSSSVDFSSATGLDASRVDSVLGIGALDLSGTASFTGTMDNVGLFSAALTAVEVQALAGKLGGVPPVVAIDNPLPAAEFPELGNITIDAQASSAKATISKVEFFNGAGKLGEADSYPYTITWAQVPLGTYAITAKATDARGESSTSAPVSIVVSADSDQDGLPDDWELKYFGNLDQTASGSYLNDGISNLTKYLLGIDPTKPITADTTQVTGLVVFTPLQ